MFGEHRRVTARNPVAANPSHLQMRGRHRQHIAVPLACRKALPRVRGVLGRVRTAVHPDGALGLLPGNVRVEGDQLLRRSVELAPDAQVRGAAGRVVGRMRLALMLGQREDRRVPAVGVQACRLVDRNPQVVADVRTGNALRLILVKPRRPLTREIGADDRARRSLREHGHDAGRRSPPARRERTWSNVCVPCQFLFTQPAHLPDGRHSTPTVPSPARATRLT